MCSCHAHPSRRCQDWFCWSSQLRCGQRPSSSLHGDRRVPRRLGRRAGSLDCRDAHCCLTASPHRHHCRSAAGNQSDSHSDSPPPQLNVDRELIKVGKAARTELLDGTIVQVGECGTLTADKVLLEFVDKKAAKKRKRETDPLPMQQRWIHIQLLTHVSRASPSRTAPQQPAPMTAARRGGPLFSETVQSSDGIVRANRPSAGEASSSSTPMPAMALHEQGRALKQKPSRELRLGHAVRGTASEHKTKETKVSISKRLTEFPNQSLTNAAGKLFCQCCAKTLQNIACTIKTHVGSDNHKAKYL